VIALLLVLLGAGAVTGLAVLLVELSGRRLEARGRAAIRQQLQAQAGERQIQAITQAAVAQMLRVAREQRPR